MVAQFKTVSEFLAMGGHASFVFGAWGLSAAIILILITRAILTGERQKARLKALEANRES